MRRWMISIALPLAACPATDETNDTLFATLTATDTDVSGTSPSTTSGSTMPPDESSTSEAVTTEGSESGPVGPCDGGICAEPPPEGWYGPIVRWDNDGSMPPLCAEGWPDDAFTLLGGYTDPGPAECSCACGITVGSVCGAYGYLYGGETCSTFTMMIGATQNCNEVDIPAGNSLYLYAYTQGTPTCNDEVTVNLPEPAWDLEVRGCRGAELGAECGDGRQCLPPAPAGFEDWLCIFSQGDLECPAGDYSEKTLLYSGVADTRSCSQCVCDVAPATTCTGNWEIFDDDECGGNVLHTMPLTGGCAGTVEGAGSFHIALSSGTECPVFKDTAPTGSIEPDGAITYCCMPR